MTLDLIGNEEVQLIFAKAFFDSTWLPENTAFQDFAGTRLLVRLLAGSLLLLFDFETVGILLRVLNFALFSFALAKFFKLFEISNSKAILILVIFILTPQSIIAGEWIFGGFEAKTAAYIFVFLALHSFLKERLYLAILFCAFAAYFHLLVGVWFAFSILLLNVLSNSFVHSIKAGVLFSGLLAPLLVYVSLGMADLNALIPSGFNLSETYVYTRVPHHSGIFQNFTFWSFTTLGVILSIGNLIVNLLLKPSSNASLSILRKLNILIQSVILVFLFLGFLDVYIFDKKLSAILALYPYRQSGISLLFTLILVVSNIELKQIIHRKTVTAIALLIIFSGLIFTISNSLHPKSNSDEAFNEVIEFARNETAPNSVFFLIVDRQTIPHKSFTRLANRENFFIFKFTPHGTYYFYEWYLRSEVFYQINQNRERIDELTTNKTIDYLVADSELSTTMFELVEVFGKYKVYKKIALVNS